MLLTRSIRRKFALGLVLVVSMLVVFTVCSVSGVISYRRMVRDLELSIASAPRRDALIATLGSLIRPLSVEFPDSSVPLEQRRKAAELQARMFADTFANVRTRVTDFERQWQALPVGLQHNQFEEIAFTTMFYKVDEDLARIADGMGQLADPLRRDVQVQRIIRIVADLIDNVGRVPDPSNRLGERLSQAKDDYLTHIRLLTGSGIVALLMTGLLWFWAQQQVFRPIRRLHRGVQKVAGGDFGYRLDAKTTCELSQLATAFNEMTQRIQEETSDKERQIEERSRQLIQSERMAGVGFLAAGVAHEINNPLTAIIAAAQVLPSLLSDEVMSALDEEDRQDVHDYLGMILSEARRCEKITKKLLDFSHGSEEERNLYDVTAIIQEVVSMLKHLGRFRNSKVELNRTDPVHAWLNGPEIKQVILNLIANGLEAMDADGVMRIRITELSDAVEVSFADEGCGMTSEQLSRIFEPFYTTKSVGKGTGLGLSISHRIVADHGGTLEASSPGPGAGSTFRLRLPRTEAAARAA